MRMTELNSSTVLFNSIIENLKKINPEIPVSTIHRDVEDLLKKLLVNEIKKLEFPRKITRIELRKLNAKYRIHKKSKRYSENRLKLEKHKFNKLYKHFKMQRLRDTLTRYEGFLNLEHLSNVGNHESSFLNIDNKTYKIYNGRREINANYYHKVMNLKDNVDIESEGLKYEEFPDSGTKKASIDENLFELDSYSKYLRKIDNLKRIKEKEITEKLKLNPELKKKYQNIKIDPISKDKIKEILKSEIKD